MGWENGNGSLRFWSAGPLSQHSYSSQVSDLYDLPLAKRPAAFSLDGILNLNVLETLHSASLQGAHNTLQLSKRLVPWGDDEKLSENDFGCRSRRADGSYNGADACRRMGPQLQQWRRNRRGSYWRVGSWSRHRHYRSSAEILRWIWIRLSAAAPSAAAALWLSASTALWLLIAGQGIGCAPTPPDRQTQLRGALALLAAPYF